ncbi:MAG: molecular chaperone [Pacificimonas sp.]
MNGTTCTKNNWWRGVNKLFTGQLLVASILAASPAPALAANDLLVAPTRILFEPRERTEEVVLKNTGDKAATYRISLVARRMTPEGGLVEVETLNEAEALAESMIRFAPRRVRLEPDQPQSIRIAARRPADLVDGEHRIHMLFRAVPDVASVADAPTGSEGMSITLTPIYGVSIPIVVQHGKLVADVDVNGGAHDVVQDRQGVMVSLSRSGNRSIVGDLEVNVPGVEDPVLSRPNVVIYHEVAERRVFIPTAGTDMNAYRGPATLRFYEKTSDGRRLVDEREITLG